MGADAYQRTLISGIVQMIIGPLCILLGIADIATTLAEHRVTVALYSFVPIWGGVWICVTGIIGINAIKRARYGMSGCMCCESEAPGGYPTQGDCCASFKCMIGLYMGFSITASVIGGLLIITYAINVTLFEVSYYRKYAFVYISWFMLILSIGVFVVAIWAAVCCCKISCGQNPPLAPVGPVVYTQAQGPPTAYIVVQGPGGTPIAIPAQTSGPMIEPGGTPVNNTVEPVAVPPHFNFGAQEPQAKENTVKVTL